MEGADCVSIPLRLLSSDEWSSRVTFPVKAAADVTLRRLQTCHFAPGSRIAWEFADESGLVTAHEHGLVTVPQLTIEVTEKLLTLRTVRE